MLQQMKRSIFRLFEVYYRRLDEERITLAHLFRYVAGETKAVVAKHRIGTFPRHIQARKGADI
jgi:hypothetical protein